MTSATPRSVHTSRRHYGCPFSRTPRADDGRLVPAGLLAYGSSASLPPSRRDSPGSGTWGDARRLQLRGQPRLREKSSLPAFPFHLQQPDRGRRRDRHAPATKQVAPTLVNRPIKSCAALPAARDRCAPVVIANAHRPTSEPISTC